MKETAARAAWWAAFLAGIALASWLDFGRGRDMHLAVLYLFPIGAVSWRFGRNAAVGSALAATASIALAKHLVEPAGGAVWHAATTGTFFEVFAWMLSYIRNSMEREREISRLKTAMLSLVSHEFGNSLAGMKICLELLKQGEDSGRVPGRSKLYESLESCRKDLTIVCSNFLNLARIESGSLELDLEAVDFRKLVREILDALAPMLSGHGIELDLGLESQNAVLRADPRALKLVLSNLIGNAVKFSPGKTPVTVSLRLEDGAALITVSDQGIGISPEDQALLFSGFFRASEVRRPGAGFGVGLQISQSLVEAHGSRLRVESVLGRGARFSFGLPLWRPAAS